MFIITYGERKFKAETKEAAEKVLRRCEEAQGQLTTEVPECSPKLMRVEEFLAAENLNSLEGVAFDDPMYL